MTTEQIVAELEKIAADAKKGWGGYPDDSYSSGYADGHERKGEAVADDIEYLITQIKKDGA